MPAPASGTAPLPIPPDLCVLLGLAAEEIAFLINPANRHYDSYARKKRNGGVRRIDEPKPRMKRAQRVIHEKILSPLELHDAAHGFRKDRSVLTAASPHAGKGVLVTADVASFFPTIRARRVAGLFRKLGFAEEAVSVLTRLTTFRGRLPQGAPTSPMISNLVTRRLDARYTGLAKRAGAVYTRYADDLAFSGPRAMRKELGWFLPALRDIAADEGFRLPRKNIAIHGAGGRQKYLGLVLNAFPNAPREYRRNLRAAIHNARATGLPAAKRAEIEGKIAWVKAVSPLTGASLSAALRKIPAFP